ncbi:MAG TPA: hypothetical protein VGM88_12305 [Kofleriaceae bacterium]
MSILNAPLSRGDLPVAISSSQWLVESVLNGTIARPQHVAAFFSNTGDEHAWTYEAIERHVDRTAPESVSGRCVRVRMNGSPSALQRSSMRGERARLDNPPFWTENPGGGRGKLAQRCTQIWKTRPLRAAQSAWVKSLGLPKRVETWIGFGKDEQHRAIKAVARNDVQRATQAFPAIQLGKPRAEQRADLARWGCEAPLFSMCVHCPFKSEERWHQTGAKDLAKAIEIDEAIRDGLSHVAVQEPAYLFDGLIPVADLVRGERRRAEPLAQIPGCDDGACFV